MNTVCFSGLRTFPTRRWSDAALARKNHAKVAATRVLRARYATLCANSLEPQHHLTVDLRPGSVLAPDFRRRYFQVFEVDAVLLQRAQNVVEQQRKPVDMVFSIQRLEIHDLFANAQRQ
jgi:hypothetical protein